MIRARKKLKSRCPSLPVKELPGMVEHYFGIKDSTPQSFQKPTQDFVKRLFYAVLDVCEDIKREELMQPMPEDMDTVEQPHNIMETMPDIVLFFEINRFLDKIGVYNCTLDSILRPTSKGFCTQVYGIMNYMKFCDEANLSINEQEKDLANKASIISSVRKRLKEQAEQLAELAVEEVADINAAEALRPDYEQNRQACITLHQKLEQGQREAAEIQRSGSRLKEQVSVLSFDLSSRLQELDHCKLQIVQSPDRLEASLCESDKLVEDMGQTLEKVRKESIQLRSILSTLEEFLHNLKGVISSLGRLGSAIEEKKKVAKVVKAQRSALLEAGEDKESKEKAIAPVLKKLEEATKMLQAEDEMHHAEQGSTEEKLVEQLRTQQSVKQRSKDVQENEISELKRKTQCYKDLVISQEQQTRITIKEKTREFLEFRKEVSEWRDKLRKAIEEISHQP